jgi:predicted Zn-dependent protease
LFMKSIQRLILAASLAAVASSGCASALQGALAAAPAFFITDQQEIALGAQAAAQVTATTPAYSDRVVQDYVQQVGSTVALKSDRPDLQYHYTVLTDATPNAFALPGGFIFITTSLLQLMTNEAQLAGVLGHETGHVAARHGIGLIREAAVAQGVEGAVLGANASQTSLLIGSVIQTLIARGYGREKEYEADKLGAIYANRTGYDPHQLPVFLNILGNATGSQPAWLAPLATHPAVPDRVKALQDQFTATPTTGTNTNPDAYLRATASLHTGGN